MTNYAPIIVLVYNRLEHFKRCLVSLRSNPEARESILYIVSDAAKIDEDREAVDEIRHFANTIDGFKEKRMLFRCQNLGAHASCDEAIKEVLKNNESFIILEDDIIVSSSFLKYMNDGLHFYRNNLCVFSICGFKAPFELPKRYDKDVYFYPSNSPWGFGTWKDRWETVNFDYFDRYSELKKDRKKYKAFASIGFYIKGILQADSRKEIVAGDLRIYYHMFQNNMCSVFPVVSKTQNWGFDGTGEHCGNKNHWWAKPELDIRNQPTQFIPFEGYDDELLKNHREFQDKINGGWLAKWLKYTWLHEIWKKFKKHK